MKPTVYLETTVIGYLAMRISDGVDAVAGSLLAGVPLPEKAGIGALHISIAAVNGIQYLLTWNCKHIANPSLRPRIDRLCREMGYEPPVICTPQELLEMDDVV